MTRTLALTFGFSVIVIASLDTSWSQEPRCAYGLSKEDPRLFNFFSSSPALRVPLVLKCGLQYDLEPVSVPDTLANMERMILTYFYGRLWPNKSFLAFLFGAVGDLLYPRIETYQMDGTPIDALDYMPYCGGVDDTSSAASVMILSTEGTVSIIDTLDCLTVDSQREVVLGSQRSIITTNVFKLDTTGHFSRASMVSQTIHWR